MKVIAIFCAGALVALPAVASSPANGLQLALTVEDGVLVLSTGLTDAWDVAELLQR